MRYAAVTSAGGNLFVAGGSLPSGTASAQVFEYSPVGHALRRLGRLPAPTTHASAAELGGVAYVIGGRGAALDTPTSRVVAIDPRTRRVHPAGHLRQPLSDAAAVSLGKAILVAGGRSSGGTQASLLALAPGRIARHVRTASALNVYSADGPNMLRPRARLALPRVYVPNSDSNTVDVIDPRRFQVVDHFAVGASRSTSCRPGT